MEWRDLARRTWEWALVAQGAALAGVALGGRSWAFDLLNHGAVWWPVLGALGAVAAVAARRPVPAAILALAAFAGTWRVVPARPAAVGGTPVRVLVANVLTANPDPARLLDFVREADPDVVALVEVSDRWIDALAPVRAAYPFHVEGPQEDNFGVALYSRLPLRDARVAYLWRAPVPSIVADLLGAHLVLTHPVPPLGADWSGMRDAHLESVEERMDDRTVVLGDLNATPWSAAFPGPAVGWRPGTWPAPFPGILRIPIDHVLVGDAIGLVSLTVGPFVGSDHRPLVADILVPDR